MNEFRDRARASFTRAAEALEFPQRPHHAFLHALLGLVCLARSDTDGKALQRAKEIIDGV